MSRQAGKWVGKVGLEIHAQIASRSKLFSGAKSQFMAPPNHLVSWFDSALPGTMPVLNKQCVEAGVLTALALSCEVQKKSLFDRKHYFYADLPAGYQITQQRQPIAVNGHLIYHIHESGSNTPPRKHRVNIKQIQLEQDSGKSLHDDVNQETLVDLNRAGVGLMEIVTEPDMTDGEEAAAFIRELQLILQKLGTCDGKMAEGSLRVDANISVSQPGQPPGQRTEIKNINSVRFVKNAIEYEMDRQIELLERGERVMQETRAYDADHICTVPMREKEVMQDYRFMPEPNLPPLILYDDITIHSAANPQDVINIDRIKETLPVLPEGHRQRLAEQYEISYKNAIILVNVDGLAVYFEETVKQRQHTNNKQTVQWVVSDLMYYLNKNDAEVATSPFSPSQMAELLDLFESAVISVKSGYRIMDAIFSMDCRTITEIIDGENLRLIGDKDEVFIICKKVLEEHPDMVEKYKKGKKKILNKLMGRVQKATEGRVDPVLASNTLKELLSK